MYRYKCSITSSDVATTVVENALRQSMTVLTVGVVATIATAGAATVVTAPALTGIATGIVEGAVVAGSAGATVAGSAAAGAVTGAISGACAGATGSAVVGSAAIGSASAAAVTSSTAGAAGLTAGIASGPIGWLVLGAAEDSTRHPVAVGATFDCWKPVVRDNSAQLSSGKLLKEILEDQRIKEVIVRETGNNKFNLPELSVVNIWDEQFDINYLVLPCNNQLVAHAVRVA